MFRLLSYLIRNTFQVVVLKITIPTHEIALVTNKLVVSMVSALSFYVK